MIKNDSLLCLGHCYSGLCSMQPTQFPNDADHISAYVKALESHVPVVGSTLENVLGPGARTHEMGRIGPLLSSMPAGWVVVKCSPPFSDSHSSKIPKELGNRNTTRSNI